MVILHTYLPMKMEETECSETSIYKIQSRELSRRKHTTRARKPNFKIVNPFVLDYRIRNKQITIKHNYIK